MSTCTYTPGTDSIDITAPGGIDKLLEFHRATFGNARMDAGDDAATAAAAAATAQAATDAAAATAAAAAAAADAAGFPKDTPVAEMTDAQQAAYWKHQSRKHEDRVKGQADYDTVKAERDALKAAGLTENEKAIEAAKATARDEAKAEARAAIMPQLVTAKFEALVGGRIPSERLTAILAPLDHTKFLTASGEVDTDKVQQYVNGLAPDGKKWPDMGQGHRGSSGKTTGVGAGRSLFEDRRPKSAATK